jgi:hypothetical protein
MSVAELERVSRNLKVLGTSLASLRGRRASTFLRCIALAESQTALTQFSRLAACAAGRDVWRMVSLFQIREAEMRILQEELARIDQDILRTGKQIERLEQKARELLRLRVRHLEILDLNERLSVPQPDGESLPQA